MNVPVMRGGGGQLIGQPIQSPGLPPRFGGGVPFRPPGMSNGLFPGGGGANRFFPPRGGFPPVGGQPPQSPFGPGGEGFPGRGLHLGEEHGPEGLGQIFHLLQGTINAQQIQRMQQGHTPGGFHGAFTGLSPQQERLIAMLMQPTNAHPQLGSPVTYGLGGTTRGQFRAQANLGMGSRVGTNPTSHRQLLSY